MSHDKNDPDTRRAKAVAYGKLALLYSSKNNLFAVFADAGKSMVGHHNIPQNVCSDFDELSDMEFEVCLLF